MSPRKADPEAARRKLTSAWISAKTTGYTGYYSCRLCGTMATCVGKTYEKMKCKKCHFGKYYKEEA